jgi:1,4-alpha-glucan branching enzyme
LPLQARALNAETKEANRTLQQFKLQEKAREKEQEAAIEAYARKKAELQVRQAESEGLLWQSTTQQQAAVLGMYRALALGKHTAWPAHRGTISAARP